MENEIVSQKAFNGDVYVWFKRGSPSELVYYVEDELYDKVRVLIPPIGIGNITEVVEPL